MTSLENIREEIKLKLTGDLLEFELTDDTLDSVITSALRELQRYVTVTRLITVPFKRCIDISELDENENINNVVAIYRTNEVGGTASGEMQAMTQCKSHNGN